MSQQQLMGLVLCTVALMATCTAAFNFPTYSLDNMPSTRFTCRDKILGGYYADAETQCQMFHVCVKVAGVGVQDFRFLCPNGTAFDQEAQTCADWGDVDCESATLYYGSDNFDLYRVGSGFESKRAPFPDEEEATFHLQRAETSDARRSKQVVINQKAKIQNSTPNYHTTNSHFNSFNKVQTFDKTTSRYVPNNLPASSIRPSTPPAPQPTTTRSTTTTTTTTTTTPAPTPAPRHQPTQQFNGQQMNYQEAVRQQSSPGQVYNPYAAYNNAAQSQSTRLNAFSVSPSSTTTARPFQQSRQTVSQYSLNDDIFRGSYSSNFFNNKNNGKEEFDAELVESKKKVTTTKATQKPTVRSRLVNRGRVTYNSSQRRGQSNFNVIANGQKPTTTTSYQPTTSTTTAAPVTRIQHVNANGRNYDNIRTNQQRSTTASVTPVTYRPSTISSSSFRIPVTPPTAQSTASPLNPEDQFYDVPRKVSAKLVSQSSFLPTTLAPLASSSTAQPAFQSKFNPNANYDLTAVQQSKFFYNPFGEPRVSPSVVDTTTHIPSPTTTTTATSAPAKQFFSPTPVPAQQFSPRGFEIIPITPLKTQSKSFISPSQPQPQRPQPFSRRVGDSKHNTPSSIKKFSTLVPRELYDPTTFKPATYKKPVDNLAVIKSAQLQLSQQESRRYNPTNFVTPPTTTTSTTTTTTPSTTTTTTTIKPAVFNYSPIQNNNHPTPSPFSHSSPISFNPQFLQNNNNNSPPTFPTTIAPQQQQFYSPAASGFNFNSFNQLSSAAPLKIEEIDENDGQYHPELYEKDFARYKIKNRKPNKIVSPASAYTFQSTVAPNRAVGIRTHYQKPVVPASGTIITGSGEEEFLKTAHSQNIVASGNQLLYDSIKTTFKQQQQQQAQQPQRQTAAIPVQPTTLASSPRPFSKTAPTIPPNATSTKRPSKAKTEKDVSYDYQYYDFGLDGSHNRDYEFDLLEDFGKLKKTTKPKKQ